jgi:hypothetical protein
MDDVMNSIEKAKEFRQAVKAEKELRDFIADIRAKLNRSDLTEDDGVRHAQALMNAYKFLKEVNLSELLKTLVRPSHGEIAQVAHQLWKIKGDGHGHDQEDWFQAEELIILLRRAEQ